MDIVDYLLKFILLAVSVPVEGEAVEGGKYLG